MNTTGTVAGTSITGKPSTLTSYEPITITNTQSSATPNPFQQMINFTSSDPGFSSIATGNFGQNVEFFYYNGTIIPSWLENYTSTNGLWWLKIAAIPAGSSETVYVGFASASANLFNTVNDGEAPQLTCPNPSDTASCSTYAEYDDGANVFNNYWNFAGTSLPSGWISSGSVTVNNGISIAYSGYAYTSSTYGHNNSTVIDFYGNFSSAFPLSVSNANAAFGFVGYNTGNAGVDAGWTINANNNQGATTNAVGQTGLSSSTFTTGISGGISATGYHVWTIYYPTAGYVLFSYNYVNSEKITSTLPTSAYPIGGVNYQGSQATIGPFYWLRIRAYPPSGVMPSVSFGSVA